MASQPKGYGLTAELERKKKASYDPDLASGAMEWIEAVLDEDVFNGCGSGPDEVQAALKDGVILDRLANALGGKIKFNQSKMAFKMMENIGNFLNFAESLGVVPNDMFQTVDLYEKKNMTSVIIGIRAVGRKAHSAGKTPHALGPKEAIANKREFTEEQLKAGQNVIGLQMGSNKGASQAGDHYGRPRQVAGANVYN